MIDSKKKSCGTVHYLDAFVFFICVFTTLVFLFTSTQC